ncbi:unnamed protein product [Rotaria magnacalcarata]|uniref:Uncharacterized protein n=1 Tax=Rotaria magnacalcarata TaxID=392030 RepID=A0A816C104_9BILA|nr:unnamed protein product [Rotaria magnacalcarata]CAF1615978.1 unnamed protein product [Rotaria magnacalcarata]CAF1994309.1 unnamed protein product [Rotaria magnacalcarata]CAF2000178.1 unnamed protein product [Rotaria magnacalcarata]CAF2157155.1 unnamed protein product [Rotaria magnacalcarata]
MLILIFNLIKRICWEVYLLFTRLPPTQAWVDPREQALMVKYIQNFKREQRQQKISMVEFGAGSSTFFFSSFVDYYVSIEHSLDYCRELERMAHNQSHRSVIIFYMGRNSSGFYIKRCFEQKSLQSDQTSRIEIYCVPRNAYSLAAYRLWATGGRSTYTMYRDYIDFLSVYFRDTKFDFAFLDGRARPQVAYALLKQLNGPNAKVFIHDWNQREAYHIIEREFYNIIDQQIESTQSGGGGLVVLEKKFENIGQRNINDIEWKYGKEPDWWI